MSPLFTSVILSALLGWSCSDDDISTYDQSWAELDSRPLPVWYDQSKIGVGIFWGVYSVPAFENTYVWDCIEDTKKRPRCAEYVKNKYGPHYKYPDLARLFKAEFFNATKWAEIFYKSGAKYVLLEAKHCDGYAMFPSNWSFNWNSVDVGPHIDIVGELSKAVRWKDLKFGIHYYSTENHHPMYKDDKNNNFGTNNFVLNKYIPELKQVVADYETDIIKMWIKDKSADDTYLKSSKFLSWLYNESPVRMTVVTNDLWCGKCQCKHGGYYTTDTCPDKDRKWELEYTIQKNTWAYIRAAKFDSFRTINTLIETLVQTVARGGNIVFNVSPSDTGQIPPIYEERLLQIGEWLSINGEAIYKTSPNFYQRDSYDKNVWYTCVKKRHAYNPSRPITPVTSPSFDNITALYAIFLKWPEKNQLLLKDLFVCVTCEKRTVIQLLGNEDKNLEWTSTNGRITISLPHFLEVKSKYAWTLRLKP